jgi:dihydrolipoamide dehydrogenase
MRTSNDRVFAIGDVAGDPMLAHAASHEAERAVAALTEEAVSRTEAVVPSVVYTDPEIATVGYTVEGAADAGFDPTVGEFDFAANGRALTSDAAEGFCRLVADEPTGQLLGADIVGVEASELVGWLTHAIDAEVRVVDLVGSIQPHPTLSEAISEAAADVSGQAIHKHD